MRSYLYPFALILIGLVLRVVDINADPPLELSPTSIGAFVDEGHKVYPAKNIYYNGVPARRQYESQSIYAHSPLYTHIELAFFKVFGCNLKAARMSSVLAWLLIAVMGSWLAFKLWGRWGAFWASFFLVFDYYLIFYSRLALQEIWVSVFIMAAICFWALMKPNWLGATLAGLMLFCAHLIKPAVVPAIGAFALAAACGIVPIGGKTAYQNAINFMKRWTISFLPVLVFIACMLAKDALWANPQYKLGSTALQFKIVSHVGAGVQGILLTVLKFFEGGIMLRNPIMWLAAFGLLWVLASGRLKARYLSRGEGAVLGMCLAYGATLAVISYRPSRYFILLLPFMSLLAAFFLSRFKGMMAETPQPSMTRKIAAALVCGAVAYGLVFILAEAMPIDLPVIVAAGAAGAVVFIACMLTRRTADRSEPPEPRGLPYKTIATTGVLISMLLYAGWFSTRTSYLEASISEFAEKMPPGSVVVNMYAENNSASSLCWTKEVDAVSISMLAWKDDDRANHLEILDKIGATHIILNAKGPGSGLPDELDGVYRLEPPCLVFKFKHNEYAIWRLEKTGR